MMSLLKTVNFKIFLKCKNKYIYKTNEMRNLRFRIPDIHYFSEERKPQCLDNHNQDPRLYFGGGFASKSVYESIHLL